MPTPEGNGLPGFPDQENHGRSVDGDGKLGRIFFCVVHGKVIRVGE